MNMPQAPPPRCGATDEEANAALAGDDLTAPDLTATRAITIHAPADLIWAWIAQLGQGRGSFYSYDWLENLLGLDMRSGTTRLVVRERYVAPRQAGQTYAGPACQG